MPPDTATEDQTSKPADAGDETLDLKTPGEAASADEKSNADEVVKEAKREVKKRQSRKKADAPPKQEAPKDDPPAPKSTATKSQVKPGHVPRRQVQHRPELHRVDYLGKTDVNVGNQNWSPRFPTRTTRYYYDREEAEFFADDPDFRVTYAPS